MSISISVVIPTYNRKDTLIRAVKSVLNQSYPILEILICDDGSTDSSYDLIAELNDPKIIWLNCGKNGRPSIPRNIGIKEAKSDWIAFLDSDDEWLPEKIEKQVEVINNNSFDFICTNANRIYSNMNMGKYISLYTRIIGFKLLLTTNYIICSSVLIKKELLINISLFPEEIDFKAIEDYELWLRISTIKNIYFIKTPLLNYFDNTKDSIRVKGINENIIKEKILLSLITWKNNFTKPTPLFNEKFYYQAKNENLFFLMHSYYLKILNKFNS